MRMLITSFAVLALTTGALAQTATPPAEDQLEPAISRDHAEQIALRHVPGAGGGSDGGHLERRSCLGSQGSIRRWGEL